MAKKNDENLKDKIKSLFRLNKDKGSPVQYQRAPVKEFVFTAEILKDIGPESPSNNRLKTIKELSEVVLKKKLEENAVEAVWCSIQDLVLPQALSEKRHVALQFLQCLLEGQLNSLGILRGHFFHVLEGLTLPENTTERLALFKILSENGRNLLEFEEEAGPALLEWMPLVITQDKTADFLPLLISAIKYNAAYMDEEIISGFVKQTCFICNQRSENDIKLCLEVLDVVVCYSYLPSDCLQDFVEALCRLVNIPKYSEPSWELMRKLLGTHLGHSSIYTMCVMLQDRKESLDFQALRGAIFYIGMALWGSRKVPLLKHTHAAVLPSFLHVLSSGNSMLAYEVILSVQRLVKKYGKELNQSTWDIVLDIVENVLKLLDAHSTSQAAQIISADPRAMAELHDTLTPIENLHETGQFSGSVARFFKIVEMCAAKRPEESVILLISHQAQSIHPGKENWINNLYQLMDKYFRNDARTKVRLKALDVLAFVLSINKHMYEDELINSVVLPHLCHIDTDADVHVRKTAVEILLVLAQNCSQACFMDVIGIVERVLSRPAIGKQMSPYPSPDGTDIVRTMDESHLADLRTAAAMLVDLFKNKLYTYPAGVCIKLYDQLITHLTAHYAVPRDYSSNTAAVIRKCIIQCLLDLRADHFHRVGVLARHNEGPQKYSPFVSCRRDEGHFSPPGSPVSTTPTVGQMASMSHLEYTRTFNLFIQALENEKNWDVLRCVLDNLPLLLQNKTIILSARRNLIDILNSKLCAMVNDRQLGFPEKLHGTPVKFTRSDFHSCIFPVLASMVTFHDYLDRGRQRELITCLEFGMVSSCAKLCVNALRICTLEMHEVMMRLLPSVLLQLSKISATNSMAIPVLAFLSSIVRCPKMYANFVEDEYMSVFAIALPYTNPFKFSHYTVSLAHHVIAIWFIRCRLPFRKGFVKFIQKGLKANVLQQFEENAKLALQNQNQDSSDRARSGSYSEAALRSRRRMQSGSAISRSDIHAPVDEKLSQFHRELTETCTDVMARYTFGNFSPLPHRSNMAEFLLDGGQTQTWLVGNKLITITTSGSGNKVGNSGVCEKCQAIYQSNEMKENKPSSQSIRRRHRSEITFSRSSSSIETKQTSSQDDMRIQSKTSLDDMNLDELAAQDASVQTGSSLTDPSVGNEPLESFILGLKGSDSRHSTLNLCNCWSTNWAEIYIRAPSGNLSWMMRIENEEAGLFSVQGSQIQDFSMLLASMGQKKRPKPERQNRRIESGSIGEEEYESLYAQHFPGAQSEKSAKHHPMGGKDIKEVNVEVENDPERHTESQVKENIGVINTHQVSEALQIPSGDSAGNHDLSPGSLRRSNSSPSVMSGSSDTLSPRDSISDIVQFGPKLDKLSASKEETAVKPSSIHKGFQEPDSVVPRLEQNIEQVKSDIGTQPSSIAEGRLDEQPSTSEPSSLDSSFTAPKTATSMLSKQLSPSPASSETSSSQDEVGELPSHLQRRGHTMGVTQGKTSAMPDSYLKSGVSKESTKVGISPSFVFLQLYHSGQLQLSETPQLLQNNENVERAIRHLDYIFPYETHKIGVIYVGPGQTKDEKAILSNEFGSERYMSFVQSLGTLLRLRDSHPQRTYLGGLSEEGKDGEFTYNWQDESIQMVFHIATLMPNKDTDKNCNAKKLHIGNDNVTVVYNDSGEDYSIGVIKGQFNYVNIVIKPLDYESNAVTLQAKEDIAEILGHKDTKIISDSNLATLVRQIAIHCNLGSMVLQRQQTLPQDPFANNWLERLRKIRRMKSMIDTSSPRSESHSSFTEYV